jgi:hypothetical protein
MHAHEMLLNITFLGNSYGGIAYKAYTFIVNIVEGILSLPFSINLMQKCFQFLLLLVYWEAIVFSSHTDTQNIKSFVCNMNT